MKNVSLLLLIFGMLFFYSGNSFAHSWVITKEGKTECKQVRIGIANVRILLQDGKKIAIPFKKVNSFSQEGRIYTRLCLYRNGRSCQRTVFMELVKSRGTLSLYKYLDTSVDPTFESFYVYKGDVFCYALDESVRRDVVDKQLRYFGIRPVFTAL